MYLKEGQFKKIPAFFAEKTRQTLKSNDVINEWWEDNIELDETYKCQKEEINKNRGNIDLKELIEFIKNKGFEYNKVLTKPSFKIGGWKGFRFREASQEE